MQSAQGLLLRVPRVRDAALRLECGQSGNCDPKSKAEALRKKQKKKLCIFWGLGPKLGLLTCFLLFRALPPNLKAMEQQAKAHTREMIGFPAACMVLGCCCCWRIPQLPEEEEEGEGSEAEMESLYHTYFAGTWEDAFGRLHVLTDSAIFWQDRKVTPIIRISEDAFSIIWSGEKVEAHLASEDMVLKWSDGSNWWRVPEPEEEAADEEQPLLCPAPARSAREPDSPDSPESPESPRD